MQGGAAPASGPSRAPASSSAPAETPDLSALLDGPGAGKGGKHTAGGTDLSVLLGDDPPKKDR
jgi:hypothetical protein